MTSRLRLQTRKTSGWARPASDRELPLENGSRVAIIGGGPAGSFLAFFLLKFAAISDLRLDIDIFEPRSFLEGGPGGCNHCGGIVSEALVQTLAAEGINLPPTVVQRGIESYRLHMDIGSVTIDSPVGEQRIAAVYRGNGPRGGEAMPWDSFDGFLQQLAEERGARLVRKLVTGIVWQDGRPRLLHVDGETEPYDFVAIATGVNSNFWGMADLASTNGSGSPVTASTYICEFRSDQETIKERMGNSMHIFLVDVPGLEFSALIPKGDYVTLAMLGEEIDADLIRRFLDLPPVRRAMPFEEIPWVCSCTPLINVSGPPQPYADRLVMVGDAGVTRLYKDGIGAAYRTAKAAAITAVLYGVSTEAFREHYQPVCKDISRDNAYGRFLFTVAVLFRKLRLARRAVLRMTRYEQSRDPETRRLSGVLWNLFTGSAPYREVFKATLSPMFVGGIFRHLVGRGPGPVQSKGKTGVREEV